jgi:hypothetical protein
MALKRINKELTDLGRYVIALTSFLRLQDSVEPAMVGLSG